FNLYPTHQSNQNQTSAGLEAAEIPLPVCRTDEVLDHIDALTVGDFFDPFGKVLLLIIAPGSGPQLDATVDFFGRTCSDKYARASLASHLDAGSTDTARSRIHQDFL